eukprot:scaffold269999_cov30-Tisochrysis_lutea.AAC.3
MLGTAAICCGMVPVETLRRTAPATLRAEAPTSPWASNWCDACGCVPSSAACARSALRLSRQSEMASVKKMVMPMGAATATRLRPIPR